MKTAHSDLIVIGGGPGGYVAAIRASQLGQKVTLVERAELGGICLNWGCIPTKALLHTARTLTHIRAAAELGIMVPEGVRVDLPRTIARSREVSARLRTGVSALLKKNGVTVHHGQARLDGPGKVIVTPESGAAKALTAPAIIVATGASPREIDSLPIDGQRIWNYRHALTPLEMPTSLLVVGAGAIGMEFASLYAALGARVTVIEMLDRVLPSEDEEVSQLVAKAYAQRDIEVRTQTSAALNSKHKDHVSITLRNGDREENVKVDRVLVCAGVVGNTQDLGLESTRVVVDRGCIRVNAHGQTAEPSIYAIGDVSGAPMLAHKASHEGIRCAEYLAGQTPTHSDARMPSCTYCDPQVASIGLTERQARERGGDISVGRFPFNGNGKALAIGEPMGFVKTIFDIPSGELLGAHLVGPDVTELIHGLSLAQRLEATEEDLMQHVYAHPTLSEAIGESVMAAYGRAIHA